MNTWIEAHKFLLNLNIGEGYGDAENRVTLVKKTNRRLYLSNRRIIHIKKLDNFFYFDAKGNSSNQTLRDIEGYLIYKIHTL